MDALADRRRRRLLLDLLEYDPECDAPVPIVERDVDVDAVEHLVSMKYTHLPILEVYGFIEWDDAHYEVRRGPDFEEIEPLLEVMRAREQELPVEWP